MTKRLTLKTLTNRDSEKMWANVQKIIDENKDKIISAVIIGFTVPGDEVHRKAMWGNYADANFLCDALKNDMLQDTKL